MDIDLTKYTERELVELNRRIVERIKALRQGRCRESMAELRVGDRVSFHRDCGHEVIGTIVRLNRKSVTVVSTDGAQWRVAPVFIKKASGEGGGRDESEGELIAKVQGDLIKLAERQQRDRGKA
jgi:hypothetical protein